MEKKPMNIESAMQEAESVMDQAANAPEVDTTVRKARGNFGSTTGMAKVWKSEVADLALFMTKAPLFLVELANNDPGVRESVRKAVGKAAIAYVKANHDTVIKANPYTVIPGLRVYQDSHVQVR